MNKLFYGCVIAGLFASSGFALADNLGTRAAPLRPAAKPIAAQAEAKPQTARASASKHNLGQTARAGVGPAADDGDLNPQPFPPPKIETRTSVSQRRSSGHAAEDLNPQPFPPPKNGGATDRIDHSESH